MARETISDVERGYFAGLKAETAKLVIACGGVVPVAEYLGYGNPASVSNWQRPACFETIPVSAAIALEAWCGRDFVTAYMARQHGKRLEDGPIVTGPTLDVASAISRMTTENAEAVAALAELFGGEATLAQLRRARKEVDDVCETAARKRDMLDRLIAEVERRTGPRPVKLREAV